MKEIQCPECLRDSVTERQSVQPTSGLLQCHLGHVARCDHGKLIRVGDPCLRCKEDQ